MLLLPLILFVLASLGQARANDVTRDFFGDIFRMRDCHNGSRCDGGGRRPALQVPGRPCFCQCTPSHLAYREDKQQCVKDIKECYMSVFYRPFTVEAIPLVYLPTSGQLVHPDAHLSLSMRRNFEGGLAKCRVTVSQYLTKEGWRTLTKMDGTGGSVFGLFTDVNKTFLQFLGSSHDRKLLQQHMVLVRLLCVIPQYPAFETCVAIRIGWVPGVENIEDAPTPSNKANMMVVGLSLGVLALVYIFAVLVYLKIRRQMIAKQKANVDQEAKLQSLDDASDKASTLHRLETSNRLELYHSASLGRQKPNRKGYRNNPDPWNQMSPIVETYNRTWTDRMGQHSSEFRAQDFKLQPEFFEPEFMASPPHEVLEYLERLQNSITFARHRMRSCYRYQPTLNGIPEDDYFYQELEIKDPQKNEMRTTPDGGSASSVGSLQEPAEQKNEPQPKDYPKIPPRKPKRKTAKDKIEQRSADASDQEQKEIQKAMSTLNDTLDALEYDIYKQEIMNQVSDSETANLSCQNSTSIDFDDFETSSCSSMSAVTVLGKEAKRHSDISKCNHYFEKNQSEEFSTFSNSTYSLCGLFHDGNKSSCNIDSEKSNFSSRCPSQSGYSSQKEDNANDGQNKDNKKNAGATAAGIASEKRMCSDGRPKSRAESVNNFSCDRNTDSQNIPESGLKHKSIQNQKHTFKNSGKISLPDNVSTLGRDHKLSNVPNQESKQRSLYSPSNKGNGERKVQTPNLEETEKNSLREANSSRMVNSPDSGISQRDSRTLSKGNLHRRLRTPTKDNASRNITPTQESTMRNISSPSEENPAKQNSLNRSVGPSNRGKVNKGDKSASGQEKEHNSSDAEGTLRRSPSTESMTTVATDMTTDSLDSRCTTPSHPSPTPSLMEMWINKLVSTSVPYSKNRRKSKKKLILPEEEVESWEHVCQKHKDPCPMHDLNDSEPNLIDKLAHYGSKTMAGCDVAGYFQSLKQDVLKEHLKLWLTANNQNKSGLSLDCSHKKPLVTGQESNLVDENGMHLSNRRSQETPSEKGPKRQDIGEDSLESDSAKRLNENETIYFGGLKEANEKPVQT